MLLCFSIHPAFINPNNVSVTVLNVRSIKTYNKEKMPFISKVNVGHMLWVCKRYSPLGWGWLSEDLLSPLKTIFHIYSKFEEDIWGNDIQLIGLYNTAKKLFLNIIAFLFCEDCLFLSNEYFRNSNTQGYRITLIVKWKIISSWKVF